MASVAVARRTLVGRGGLAGLCGVPVLGVAVLVAAGCSSVGAGGSKSGTGHVHHTVAAPVVQITPATGARGVRPDAPIRVQALSGRLVNVTVRAGGRDVAGQ